MATSVQIEMHLVFVSFVPAGKRLQCWPPRDYIGILAEAVADLLRPLQKAAWQFRIYFPATCGAVPKFL